MRAFNWTAWAERAVAEGKRPTVGTLCPSCYRLIPRINEARQDIDPKHWCVCPGQERSSLEAEYATHGLPFNAVNLWGVTALSE